MSDWQPVIGRQCGKCGSSNVVYDDAVIACAQCGFKTDHEGNELPLPVDLSQQTPMHQGYRAAIDEAKQGLELTRRYYKHPELDKVLEAFDEQDELNPHGGLASGDVGALATVRSSKAHEGLPRKHYDPIAALPDSVKHARADAVQLPTGRGKTFTLVPRPSDVVDLRASLVHFWQQDSALTRELAMQGRFSKSEKNYWEEGGLSRRWMHGVLKDAELYWVSPDMCTLLQGVADSMPDVAPEPPVPEALVVFANPLEGVDAMSGNVILTAAYLWGPVMIEHLDALEIETFGWRDLIQPAGFPEEEVQLFRQTMPTKLVTTGGSEWPWHALTSDFTVIKGYSPRQIASMAEDRRKLAAFWALCQDRITVERPERQPRAAARRAARAGLPTNPVRVITLREASHVHASSGEGANYSHRFPVSGHWRQQPYGPRASLRRAQWIPTFIKGPKDKPLLVRDTVRALKR